ncbi:MAG: hypothetical protein ACRDYA_16755 [Egibacteraceae bacterium]
MVTSPLHRRGGLDLSWCAGSRRSIARIQHASVLALAVVAVLGPTACADAREQAVCDPSYPDNCIFPAPPDLGCRDTPHRIFRVRPPDPHQFDQDNDGFGCSMNDMRLERREGLLGSSGATPP